MEIVVEHPYVLLRIVRVHLDLVRAARAFLLEDLVVLGPRLHVPAVAIDDEDAVHPFPVLSRRWPGPGAARRISRPRAAQACRAGQSTRGRAFRQTRRPSNPTCSLRCPESAAASFRRLRTVRIRLRRPFPASAPMTGRARVTRGGWSSFASRILPGAGQMPLTGDYRLQPCLRDDGDQRFPGDRFCVVVLPRTCASTRRA